MKPKTPHDILFKQIWGKLDHAKSFLENNLPATTLAVLNLNTLVKTPGTFVDDKGKETRADILYKVELKHGSSCYIYILLEHKSNPDRSTPLQLLGYMVRIWKQHQKNTKANVLTPIIPMVVYHGKNAWPWKPTLASQFENSGELEGYIPNFQFRIQDLSGIPDEEIMGTILIRVVQQLFKYVHWDTKFKEKFPLLLELLHKNTGLEYIEVVLRYIFATVKDVSNKEMVELVDQAIPDGGNIMGTLAEKWEAEKSPKWIQQGKLEGRLEGKLEGKLESIKAVLKSKFGREGLLLIEDIRKIDNPQKLDSVLTEIILAPTFEDLRKKLTTTN